MSEMFTFSKEIKEKQKGVSYGEVKLVEYMSKFTGCMRRVNVILPPDYNENEKYPVVYMLHGIGGDETEWFGANPLEMLGNMMAKGECKKMIAVIPNVRARKDDRKEPEDIFTFEHFHAFDSFVEDLLGSLMPFMTENFSTLQGRENTAICGFSMGGRETLYISCTHPELFGYVGAFSPAIGVLSYTSPFVSEKGLLSEETMKWPKEYPTTIMIVNGDNDMVVGEQPERYHNTLAANDTEHIYYITKGGHNFDVWSHGLYNFLKKIFR